MKILDKVFDIVTRILVYIGCLAFCIVMVCVVLNVIGRTVGAFTIAGIMEIVQYGMLAIMSIAIARTAFQGVHVRVSLFTDKMPAALRGSFLFVEGIIGFVVFGISSYQCFTLVPKMIESGRITDIYKVPYYVVYVFLGIGLLVSAFTFLYCGLHDLVHKDDKKDPNEPVNEMVL